MVVRSVTVFPFLWPFTDFSEASREPSPHLFVARKSSICGFAEAIQDGRFATGTDTFDHAPPRILNPLSCPFLIRSFLSLLPVCLSVFVSL